jgi:hypothetical protein
MAGSSFKPTSDLVSPIAALAVGITGCVVRAQVVEEDDNRSIPFKDIY